jgi:hypothetical protein
VPAMRLQPLLIIFLLFGYLSDAQKLSIKGNVQDTAAKKPLQNAVIIATKLSDSTLIDFTRSNEQGFFEIKDLPIDTYKVVISFKKFGDKIMYVIGTNKSFEFNFDKIIMPPKSVDLDEVTIFAYKDPVYYKGDTLIYTADSFKVKPNATVEDLLRRLPGVKVDANGKITAQGKEVSKVLVDGDEFFGADPTMATKNLAANAVESVQVYEKKDENASADNTSDETIKVMNLKLKDDAKKGYFGKISGAGGSDFLPDRKDFYEGEFLANRFRNKQKISVFALGSNTPKTGFGWQDLDKYGLEDENDWSYDEDNNTWTSSREQGQGVPQTLNGGIYYSDKLNKRTKINSNYSYKNNFLLTESDQKSQYFLTDTNYITNNYSKETKRNQAHTFNLEFNHELDSFAKLTITPKLRYNINDAESYTRNQFATTEEIVSRQTENTNKTNSANYDISSGVRFTRTFRKKDRFLNLYYSIDKGANQGNGQLATMNTFFTSTVSGLNDFDQRKETNSDNITHQATASFFEPFTKKIKGEVTYEIMYNENNQTKVSLNKLNNDYSLLDSVFSNDFSNTKMVNTAKVRLIYEIKKYRIVVGTKARHVDLLNINNYSGKRLTQSVSNILPFFNYNYNFSQNTRLYFTYNTNSSQPTINQLQPLPNNTNQNFITLGNPNLSPTFSHNFNLNFNSYKPISGKYFWMGGNFNYIENAFSSNLVYDSLGRSISTPTNVNGNYNGGGWLGANFPTWQRQLIFSVNGNTNLYSNNNIINNVRNTTSNNSYSGGGDVTLDLEKFYFSLGASYDYNVPHSTINNQNNRPYTSQHFTGNFRIEFPKKIFIESDANYNINSQRTNGYNINIFIVNGSIYKHFGKLENLIISVKAFDIFNQNKVVSRQVYNNIITDTKTKIITRYFLLNITYKFNSQKKKEEGRDD